MKKISIALGNVIVKPIDKLADVNNFFNILVSETIVI